MRTWSMRRNPPARRLGRRVGALLVGSSLLAASMVGANESEAGRRPPPPRRPNLVVTEGRVVIHRSSVEDALYAFGGETVRFDWSHETRNKGLANASRSRTALRIFGEEDWIEPPPRALVPALKVGESHKGESTFNRRLVGPFWEYGVYTTKICADALNQIPKERDKRRERAEDDNCRRAHNLFLAPETFVGTVKGSAQIPFFWPGVILSWEGQLTFTGRPKPNDRAAQVLANRGGFDYRYVSGTLTYTLSGGQLCTWSGSGEYTPSATDHIKVSLDAASSTHTADVLVRPSFNFPATMTCPGQAPESLVGGFVPAKPGFAPTWLSTGGVQELTDVKRLNGSVSSGDPRTGSTTVDWDLKATP
jgi:hypothetical protein